MNTDIVLSSRAKPGLRLRAVGPQDLEELRTWKNANKKGFFFQGDISAEMQKTWYEAYRQRPGDFMFIVEHQGRKVGCMGFRMMEKGDVDTYNMIAAPGSAGRGFMKAGMTLMCSYIAVRHGRDIGCLVVLGNPAVKYYEHCGYRVVGEGDGHHVLKLDWSVFKPEEFDVTEKAS